MFSFKITKNHFGPVKPLTSRPFCPTEDFCCCKVNKDIVWKLYLRLFYLFVRVYADLCTVKTMNFWYNEAIIQ